MAIDDLQIALERMKLEKTSTSATTSPNYQDLIYIINHFFLPPKLPATNDSGPGPEFETQKKFLVDFVRDCLGTYASKYNPPQESGFGKALHMVMRASLLRSDGFKFEAGYFAWELKNLEEGGFIVVHVESQNAAVLIERTTTEYEFSFFEVSACNEAIITTKGRLLRNFPGTTISVDSAHVTTSFCNELSFFLERIDAEVPPEALMKASKAGKKDVIEVRDSALPIFVTEMLSGILRGMGREKEKTQFFKRIRDDVVYGQQDLPWRRSPTWLVLRVALQHALCTPQGPNPHLDFKLFMLHVFDEVITAAKKTPDFSHELLYIMNVKLARRVQKLAGQIPDNLLSRIEETTSSCKQLFDSTWSSLERMGQLDWKPSELNPEADTTFLLTSLRPYLKERLKTGVPTQRDISASYFAPDCAPRIQQSQYFFPRWPKEDADRLLLADMEDWVAKWLLEWVDNCRDTAKIPRNISRLFQDYAEIARKLYEGCPEDISIMVLTLLSLWVAMDTAVADEYPLVLQYPINLPSFESLLLPKKSQLEQFKKIMDYVAKRNKNAEQGYPSPLSKDLTHDSFTLRFYESTYTAPAVHQLINATTERKVREKEEEYERRHARYLSLTTRASALEHDMFTNRIYGYTKHDKFCRKCKFTKEAKEIEISVYERPLPDDQLKAKAAVAELVMPSALTQWRDMTFEIMTDITGLKRKEAAAEKAKAKAKAAENQKEKKESWKALEYAGLKPHIRSDVSMGTVHLASYTKPFSRSHYGEKGHILKFNASTVCVPNGLQYALHFAEEGLEGITDDFLVKGEDPVLRKACTPMIYEEAYKSLANTLSNTTHTSNQIIARQDSCHNDLTLHEFYAFGTLRAGHRLQWRNIAREITAQALNFNDPDVHSLVTQAIWQLGPATDSDVPEAHLDLLEQSFVREMYEAVEKACDSLSNNWQSTTALRTLIAISTRMLNLTPTGPRMDEVWEELLDKGCALLAKMCAVAMRWTEQLLKRLDALEAEDSRTGTREDRAARNKRDAESIQLSEWILETSMTALQVFNVDTGLITSLLDVDGTEDMAAFALSAAIISHTHMSTPGSRKPLQVLINRHNRVLQALEPALRNAIYEDISVVDKALCRMWEAYSPIHEITAFEEPDGRWIEGYTSEDGIQNQVCINLLTGELLVNGKPLSSLPKEYSSHPDIVRLFGSRVIQTMSPSMAGMDHSMKSFVESHKVSFGTVNGNIVIRSKCRGIVYEYIPPSRLGDDFPDYYKNDFVHWLNLNTYAVELRKLDKPWNPPSFLLEFYDDGLSFYRFNLRGGVVRETSTSSAVLLDNLRATGLQITNALAPLETSKGITLKYDKPRYAIYVELPRYSLSFIINISGGRVNSGLNIRCKNYPGFYVDPDQKIETFTGLENKLVIRNNSGIRAILVPEGTVNYSINDQHVSVRIDTTGLEKVPFHHYTVDKHLSRLVGSGSLMSQLYRIYLHAVTSHFLPDTLTGRTGTEEALYQLDAGTTTSFQELSDQELAILRQIADLTPKRRYYPVHLRTMQIPTFISGLPQLTQHPRFVTLVKKILNHAQNLQIFQEEEREASDFEIELDQHLHLRYSARNTIYYSDGFTDDAPDDLSYDVVFKDRHSFQHFVREERVCKIARLTNNWSTELDVYTDLMPLITAWKKTVSGPLDDILLKEATLGFEWSHLEPYESFMPAKWCSFQPLLTNSNLSEDTKKSGIMFFLSTLAYSHHADMQLIQTLLALATVPQILDSGILPPADDGFDFSTGFKVARNRLSVIVKSHFKGYGEQAPEFQLRRRRYEDDAAFARRRKEEFESKQEAKADSIVGLVISSWVNWRSMSYWSPFDSDDNAYFNASNATDAMKAYVLSCDKNKRFQEYIERMNYALKCCTSRCTLALEPFPVCLPPSHDRTYRKARSSMDLSTLLERQAPSPQQPHRENIHSCLDKLLRTTAGAKSGDHRYLDHLIQGLERELTSAHEKEYIEDLRKSLRYLNEGETIETLNEAELQRHNANRYYNVCDYQLKEVQQQILLSLCRSNSKEDRILLNVGLWPRISKSDLLNQLRECNFPGLKNGWKEALIFYAKVISDVQRAQRMQHFIWARDHIELTAELSNKAHSDWDVSQNPEWLLLELESNLLIRSAQARTAMEMMAPSTGKNSILQLNMGEGKTSVIVPIIASKMADGNRLVRVVVLRPLAKQMFRLLVRKLGGLLNRRIFYMPFNRKLKLDEGKAKRIRAMYEDCLLSGGILLVQPEHLLSFKLMGYERTFASTGGSALGAELHNTQKWLDTVSRDILDESDEILNVKFELVYAIGIQKSVEFAPDRWKIIIDTLEAVRRRVAEVNRMYSDGLELVQGKNGSFPRTRIIDSTTGKILIEKIAKDVCAGKLERAAFKLPQAELWAFLTSPNVNPKTACKLKAAASNSESIWNTLLLLKGLISGGVLEFALSKRWRVNYGLDPHRTMLAVPYRAKDSPVSRAEFSHPDSTIVLTALSYYYGGLTNEQMFTCVEHLLSLDFKEEEYARWMRDAPETPSRFRRHHAINLRNRNECIEDLFPALQHAKAVIDFYLVHFVFPKELKEYPHKLSASGWDIAETKPSNDPTTGFSGTNDSRYVLPLSVAQADLEDQQHTNAKVLSCILQPENRYEELGWLHASAREIDIKVLLKVMCQRNIRVLIDVGAQVLEMTNRELAHAWLFNNVYKEDQSYGPGGWTKPQAIVYFEDNDELTVLSRDNKTEPFMLSPYADQLEKCVVYLDEIHTRGTDLKLPTDYRAAVTLGPHLTKDRLVQACMRMRKLGKGQAVTFFAPREVQCAILDLRRKGSPLRNIKSVPIQVLDVLRWTIAETCSQTRKAIPLWAHHGIRYQKQASIRQRWKGNLNQDNAGQLLEVESKGLEERYGSGDGSGKLDSDKLVPSSKRNLEKILERCKNYNLQLYGDAAGGVEEEQERELSPENEREIEILRPPKVIPATHSVSKSAVELATTGRLSPLASDCTPAFHTLILTTFGQALANHHGWSSKLLATPDFAKTVKDLSSKKSKEYRDFYLRPVNWVLTSVQNPGIHLLISPFEANALIPHIRGRNTCTLSPYSARISRSSEQALSQMDKFVFGRQRGYFASFVQRREPESLYLNIFSGQLYFSSFLDYSKFCSKMGVLTSVERSELSAQSLTGTKTEIKTSLDGFVAVEDRVKAGITECEFGVSPIGFVLELAKARRKGISVERSHVGRVCRGGVLGEEDF